MMTSPEKYNTETKDPSVFSGFFGSMTIFYKKIPIIDIFQKRFVG